MATFFVRTLLLTTWIVSGGFMKNAEGHSGASAVRGNRKLERSFLAGIRSSTLSDGGSYTYRNNYNSFFKAKKSKTKSGKQQVLVKTTYDQYGNQITITYVNGVPSYNFSPCYGSNCFVPKPSNNYPPPSPSPQPKPVKAPSPPTPYPYVVGTDPIIPRTSAPTSSPKGNSQQGLGGDFNFAPPETVVEQPSSTQKKTVTSTPLIYESVGMINLVTIESVFFSQVQFLFSPYLVGQIGGPLISYKLILTFQETAKYVSSLNTDNQNPAKLYHNIFQAAVRVELEGTTDELQNITETSTQSIVSNFFQGDNLEQLIEWLGKKGIQIEMIRPYDARNQDTRPSGGNNSSPGAATNKGKKIAGIIIALVCIFGATAAILVLIRNRKSKRIRYESQSYESPMGSGFSSGSSQSGSSFSGVKASALQRNRNEKKETSKVKDLEEPYKDSLIEFYSSSSSKANLFSTAQHGMGSSDDNYSGAEIVEPFQEKAPTHTRGNKAFHSAGAELATSTQKDASTGLEQQPLVPGGRDRNKNNRDIDASSKGRDPTLSQYDMFLNGSTTRDPYDSQRKRWQDEANDPDLLGLPDHVSSGSFDSDKHLHVFS